MPSTTAAIIMMAAISMVFSSCQRHNGAVLHVLQMQQAVNGLHAAATAGSGVSGPARSRRARSTS